MALTALLPKTIIRRIGKTIPRSKMKKQETVIVCISNPLHAESLILRGTTLAKAFPGGRCLVVNIHPRPYDRLQFAELMAMQMFHAMSLKHGVPLLERFSGNRPVAAVLAEIVKEESVTQIVIGQCPRHRFFSLFQDSLINQFLKYHTGADLHVVETEPADQNCELALDRGMNAWIAGDSMGRLRMYHERHLPYLVKGIFFKRSATDFEHGYFVPWPGESPESIEVFKVIDGYIAETDTTRLRTKLATTQELALCG